MTCSLPVHGLPEASMQFDVLHDKIAPGLANLVGEMGTLLSPGHGLGYEHVKLAIVLPFSVS